MLTKIGKSSGVLCGVPFFNEIFKSLGCSVEWKVHEGTHIDVSKGARIPTAVVRGEARKILVGERTALNLLARASGIATEARKVHEIAAAQGWKVQKKMRLNTFFNYTQLSHEG